MISIEEAATVHQNIRAKNLLNEQDTSCIVYDFRILHSRIERVISSFPDHWKHAVAIKSNPLIKTLQFIGQKNFGLEAASYEEVILANKAKASFIIWDSPTKTNSEFLGLSEINSPVTINANSLEELALISKLSAAKSNLIGLRINPELNSSALKSMSVGMLGSKFGEPISNREAIIKHFRISQHPLGLHVHFSSQNIVIQESVAAIKLICDLAEEIGVQHISYVDIGGGFPVNYGFQDVPEIEDYAIELKENCPLLFTGSIPVYTEFGRYYHANAGFAISDIAEVKSSKKSQTIIHHLGANMFLRESYEPGKWPHRCAVILASSQLRMELPLATKIGGPLCFGGDYIEHEVQLPQAKAGDKLLIMDAGANTFSLWSAHCSRLFPKIIAIDEAGNLYILKERQKIEALLDLWL